MDQLKSIDGLSTLIDELLDPKDARFIQINFYDNPYFRVGNSSSDILLSNFLKSVNVEPLYYRHSFSYERRSIPRTKGEIYELVGAGVITGGTFIKENTYEVDSHEVYIIKGECLIYNLFPSMVHISKLLKDFDLPVLFGGIEFRTEEEKGFFGSGEDYEGLRDDCDGCNINDYDTSTDF